MQATALFVVTGGPGSGKTSLIQALSRRGMAFVVESGRAIIRDEVTRGGSALPWADRRRFAERMFEADRASYSAATARGVACVFDRGIPDTIGYLRLCGLAVPDLMDRTARDCRYASPVFVTPDWPEIFAQDAERKQTFAESQVTCRVMRQTYADYGYQCLDLPLASIAERTDFVLAHTVA